AHPAPGPAEEAPAGSRVALELPDLFDARLKDLEFLVRGADVLFEALDHSLAHLRRIEVPSIPPASVTPVAAVVLLSLLSIVSIVAIGHILPHPRQRRRRRHRQCRADQTYPQLRVHRVILLRVPGSCVLQPSQ